MQRNAVEEQTATTLLGLARLLVWVIYLYSSYVWETSYNRIEEFNSTGIPSGKLWTENSGEKNTYAILENGAHNTAEKKNHQK